MLIGMTSPLLLAGYAQAQEDADRVIPGEAADRPGAESAPANDEMTPELDNSVRRGLASLAAIQNTDGSFGRGRYGRHVERAQRC